MKKKFKKLVSSVMALVLMMSVLSLSGVLSTKASAVETVRGSYTYLWDVINSSKDYNDYNYRIIYDEFYNEQNGATIQYQIINDSDDNCILFYFSCETSDYFCDCYMVVYNNDDNTYYVNTYYGEDDYSADGECYVSPESYNNKLDFDSEMDDFFNAMFMDSIYCWNELLADKAQISIANFGFRCDGDYRPITLPVKIVGLMYTSDGWRYYNSYTNKTDYSYNGLASNENGIYLVKNGKVNFDYSGLYYTNSHGYNGWYLLKNGKVCNNYTGLTNNQNGWYYVQNGKINFNYTGLANNSNGWYFVEDGKVNFKYNGFAENENGTYLVNYGKVNFKANGLYYSDDYYVYGWRLVKNGKVDDNYIGLANNQNGWYVIYDGYVDFSYTGLMNNENGWYYAENGKVNFKYNGLAENENGTYCVKNGKVDFSVNGLYYGALYGTKGWYYLQNGKVDYSFTGIATNQNGSYYVQSGILDFTYSGVITQSDVEYTLVNSKVQSSKAV